MNDFKQVGLAFHVYHDTYRSFPIQKDAPGAFNSDGRPHVSWRGHLTPYLEEQAVFDKTQLDRPWDDAANAEALAAIPKVFKAAGSKEPHATTVQMFSGPGTLNENPNGMALFSIIDGTSNTILTIETGVDVAVPWLKPADVAFDENDPWKPLGTIEKQTIVGLCDGSVRRLPRTVAPEVLKAMITYAGKELVEIP